ncbi:relaxase/mobilization nuclease domain-containing protein [Hyphomicrobium sp.]|uniref:relaxase/mobilization nuclease domain-containing protein n=1 Tax=Hyphomicrobium sp. TaxID=82 RepID=UPI003D12CD54
MTQHLGETSPDDAWRPMRDTWEDRTKLKILNGVPTTGRDNKTPVLHYTLAWHKDDQPTPEHMQKMALETLGVMGLAEHQAVIAAHSDKVHLHVHVVVNTVHPETGKTAQLKYTKEKLSKWAEAYERAHGIHCEERIANNAERERHAQARMKNRRLDPTDLLMNRKGDAKAILMAAPQPKARKPYVPVKHKATSRNQWFEKKEISSRMRIMRATLDAELKVERDATWARHEKARDALDAETDAKVELARANIRDKYRPKWRSLYGAQRREARYVDRIAGNLFERAAFVYHNRERLGPAGIQLTLRQMLPLIRSGKLLQKRVANIHEQERRALARQSKTDSKELTGAIWQRHKFAMTALRDRQSAERQHEKDAQALRRKSISFAMAKAALVMERENAPRSYHRAPDLTPERKPMPPPERFREAPPKAAEPPPVQTQFERAVDPDPPAALTRAELIKRDMEAWRARNQGRDFGREL